MDLALRAAPTDAEVLSAAGLADMEEGDLGSALAKLERAREIDPRSYITLYSLSQVYDYLGRAADARGHRGSRTAGAAGRPERDPVGGHRAGCAGEDGRGPGRDPRRPSSPAFPRPTIAAHFAGFQETSWILEDRERQLVFRLTPSAFDNDRAFWGQSLAMAYWQRGEPLKARAYADSALAASKSQAEAAPKDAQLPVLYGLVLAYAGKAAEARAAGGARPDARPQRADAAQLHPAECGAHRDGAGQQGAGAGLHRGDPEDRRVPDARSTWRSIRRSRR